MGIGSLLVASLGLIGGMMGCDTVAKVSFQTENFDRIRTAGLSTLQGQCNAPGQSGGVVTMRFALITDEDRPIRRGDTVNQQGVEVSTDDISFQGDAYAFESPDRVCTTGESSNGATPVMCTESTMCQNTIGTGEEDFRRCATETSLGIESVSYESQKEGAQRFGILVENTSSILGFYPDSITSDSGTYYDDNGDGLAEVGPADPIRDDLASDETNLRNTALQDLESNWESATAPARSEDITTRFGLWTIQEDNQPPLSLVDEVTSQNNQAWTADPEMVSGAVEEFGATDAESRTRADIWQAINLTLTEHYTDSNDEKFLTVIVDGPPEVPSEASGVSPSDVIETARQNNVRVFMVQFDPKIREGKKVLFRDDPFYYQEQSETCESESDCLPYETCREVRGYGPQGESVLSATPEAGSGDPEGGTFTPNTYCMPQRGPQGRFGPIPSYARLACATEGGYRYLKTTGDLRWAVPWLPYAMDGLWKVEARVGAFLEGGSDLLNGQPVRLQTQMAVDISSTEQTRQFSQIGAERNPNNSDSGDNRGVVFTGGSSSTGENDGSDSETSNSNGGSP